MKKLNIKVKGMSNAGSAHDIIKVLSATKGVLNAHVSFSKKKGEITYDEKVINEESITDKIHEIGYKTYKFKSKKAEKKERKYQIKKSKITIIICLFFPIIIFSVQFFKLDYLTTNLILTGIIFINLYLGLMGLFKNLFKQKNKNEILTFSGIFVILIYTLILGFSKYISPGVSRNFLFISVSLVILVVNINEFLKHYFKAKFKKISELISSSKPINARVVRNGTEISISADEVKVGDLVIIKTGEMIPADGIIVEGNTKINEEVLTSNSKLIEKSIGDEVFAASTNMQDTIVIKSTQVADDITLNQIQRLIHKAKKKRSQKEETASRMQYYLIILFFLLAVISSMFWFYIRAPYFVIVFSFASILLISYPFAFYIGIRNTYNYGIDIAAHNAILYKKATIIEAVTKINTLVFSKTGIVTKGIFEVSNVIPKEGYNEKRFLILAGSVLAESMLPIAYTVKEFCKKNHISFMKVENFRNIEGLGMMGTIEGQEILVGNMNLMQESNVIISDALLHKSEILSKNLRTPLFAARNREVIGVIGLSDSINTTIKRGIELLKKINLEPVLITSDNMQVAENFAEELRITEAIGNLTYEDKIELIKNYKKEKRFIATIGNGIDDSKILEEANVGISFNTGTDTQLKFSDISILNDDFRKIEQAITLGNKINKTAKLNIFITLIFHIIGIPLAGGITYLFTNIIIHPAMAVLFVSVLTFAINYFSLHFLEQDKPVFHHRHGR